MPAHSLTSTSTVCLPPRSSMVSVTVRFLGTILSQACIDDIYEVGGRAILPSIINGMESVANASDPLKFVYTGISYKPFLSLFNMTGIAETYPQLQGIGKYLANTQSYRGLISKSVEYAASMVFELRNGSSTSDPMIRLRFKNGTNDIFTTYNMFGGSGDVPLSLFKSKFSPVTINSTAQWCQVCNNNADRGCGTCNSPALASAAAAFEAGVGRHKLSPPVAGVIGAAVTAAVFLLALGALAACGWLKFGTATNSRRVKRSESPNAVSSCGL